MGSTLGVIAGGAWGAAIQHLAIPSSPSLAIVGRRDVQIVLLDTSRTRVLILLGIPEDDLELQIPALLTMLRQRIDLVVGSISSIEALDQEFMQRWQVTTCLVFPESTETGPDGPFRTWITSDLAVDLGNGISLQLTSTMRGAWNAAAAPRNLWQVFVTNGQEEVSLTPNDASASALAPQAATLLITPRADPHQLLPVLYPAVIATNARDDLALPDNASREVSLVRTYPQDISRFELIPTGLRLPSWSESTAPS